MPLGERALLTLQKLMARFSLGGGHRHSGPAYAFNEKSFINAIPIWLQ